MLKFFEKFNYENIAQYLTYLLILLLVWGSLWSVLGDEAVPPNGYLFNLLVVFVVAYLAGEVTGLIGLPPLLGMLIAGFVIGGLFDINLNKKLSSILREVALIIILLRAGLELDPKAIRRLSAVCLRVSFIPGAIEAVVVAFVAHYLLDFPIIWGFILGFVLAAVSPVVVVPGMILLQEQGYGVDKGLPTLVMASSSIDDVLAITGFGVCLGLAFDTNSSIIWNIFKGPVEALAGIVVGIVFGLILWYIPRKEDAHIQRLTLLIFTGIFLLFGSMAVELEGAGPLGCLVVAFVTGLKWRQTEEVHESIQNHLGSVWLIVQPFLLGLIGTEVKLNAMNSETIGWGLITLLVGLILRTLIAMAVVFGMKLNFKERLFLGLAWLPTSDVQVAIGTIALDLAREKNDLSSIGFANSMLTIAVISIFITAPIGAIAISLLGPKCLNKNPMEINPGVYIQV